MNTSFTAGSPDPIPVEKKRHFCRWCASAVVVVLVVAYFLLPSVWIVEKETPPETPPTSVLFTDDQDDYWFRSPQRVTKISDVSSFEIVARGTLSSYWELNAIFVYEEGRKIQYNNGCYSWMNAKTRSIHLGTYKTEDDAVKAMTIATKAIQYRKKKP